MDLLEHCPITDIAIVPQFLSGEYVYSIDIEGERVGIRLPVDYKEWSDDVMYRDNKHIVAGLLINGKLIDFSRGFGLINFKLIQERLKEGGYPVSPQEKYNNLFSNLFARQTFDGEFVGPLNIHNLSDPSYFKKLFFRSIEEFHFYAKSLNEDGLIDGEFLEYKDQRRIVMTGYRITYKGLSYLLKLQNEASNSKNCFIAMSFGRDMEETRKAIKEACIETGYVPIMVDEVPIKSDVTINDAMIAHIRKCKFCIADFTEQKAGVYFESGFVLGQGKQVIYTCHKKDWKQMHFDTNHFPYIRYETLNDLKKALIERIQAWII